MKKNLVIIGMPGSGKTTIGSLVAEKLNMKFVDMDNYIEKTENKSISAMFDIGEEYFRNAETKCAKELGEKNSLVIATGGGIVKREKNIGYLKKNSVIIFLNRPVEKIISDIDISSRPLLKKSINNIYKLYNERIHLYKAYANIEILNNQTIEHTASNIIDAINHIIIS